MKDERFKRNMRRSSKIAASLFEQYNHTVDRARRGIFSRRHREVWPVNVNGLPPSRAPKV